MDEGGLEEDEEMEARRDEGVQGCRECKHHKNPRQCQCLERFKSNRLVETKAQILGLAMKLAQSGGIDEGMEMGMERTPLLCIL